MFCAYFGAKNGYNYSKKNKVISIFLYVQFLDSKKEKFGVLERRCLHNLVNDKTMSYENWKFTRKDKDFV
jgi:hypothetical protein